MKPINSKSYTDHQELSQLLPWYVNKTLQGAELKAVEEHLTVCLICKRELIQLQKLAQVVVSNGSIDSAEQASFSRLKKRLHSGASVNMQADAKVAAVNASRKADNIAPFNRMKKQAWRSSALRPALAMAAALLLSLTVLMPRYIENGQQFSSNFRTLSSDTQPVGMKENEIRVVFADNVDQQQKYQILERVHGQIIGDNPTAQGVYTVRLEKDIAADHLLDVIDLLRKDRNVVFAEPAYALLSSTHTE